MRCKWLLKNSNVSEIGITDWERVKGRFVDQIIELISRKYFSDLRDVILKKVAFSPID
jgi:hypothetical protein